MEIKRGKHVKIVIDLNIGDTVRTDQWGIKLDGVDRTIEDIRAATLHSQSELR